MPTIPDDQISELDNKDKKKEEIERDNDSTSGFEDVDNSARINIGADDLRDRGIEGFIEYVEEKMSEKYKEQKERIEEELQSVKTQKLKTDVDDSKIISVVDLGYILSLTLVLFNFQFNNLIYLFIGGFLALGVAIHDNFGN